MADEAAGEAGEQRSPTGPMTEIHGYCSGSTANSAGARERAGFMEAPLVGPANHIASATTPPTARPEEGCRLILPAPGGGVQEAHHAQDREH